MDIQAHAASLETILALDHGMRGIPYRTKERDVSIFAPAKVSEGAYGWIADEGEQIEGCKRGCGRVPFHIGQDQEVVCRVEHGIGFGGTVENGFHPVHMIEFTGMGASHERTILSLRLEMPRCRVRLFSYIILVFRARSEYLVLSTVHRQMVERRTMMTRSADLAYVYIGSRKYHIDLDIWKIVPVSYPAIHPCILSDF